MHSSAQATAAAFVWLALAFPRSTASAATAATNDVIPSESKLQRDRPRLLLRPKATPFAISLPQLKAPLTDPDSQALLRQLEDLNPPHAAALALVYHLTGKQPAAERALALMNACVLWVAQVGIELQAPELLGVGRPMTNFKLAAVGGAPPYTWALAGPVKLPAGLTLDPARGTIQGTPQMSGSFALTIHVKDVNGAVGITKSTLEVKPTHDRKEHHP